MISMEFYCFVIYSGRILSHKLSPCTVSDAKIVVAEEFNQENNFRDQSQMRDCWIRAPSSVYKYILFRVLLTDGFLITGLGYPVSLEKLSFQHASGISTWMLQILSCLWVLFVCKCEWQCFCLLYTSDAADELMRV